MKAVQLPQGRCCKRLKFNEGYLRFTESRRCNTASILPDSSLAGRVFSEPAKLLLQAKHQDAYSYDRLISHCGNLVFNHALREQWRMSKGQPMDFARAERLAELAIYPYVHEEPLDDSKSARYLGVSRSVWLNRWQARMMSVRWWVERWHREGKVDQ